MCQRNNPSLQSKEYLIMFDLSFFFACCSLSDTQTHTQHSEVLQDSTASLSPKQLTQIEILKKKKRQKKGFFSSSMVAFFPAYLFHCDSEAVVRQPANHLDTHNV